LNFNKFYKEGFPVMIKKRLFFMFALFLAGPFSFCQENPLQEQEPESSFGQAALSVNQQLEDSLTELAMLQEQIAAEKIPLSQKLNDLEDELANVRREYQQTSRLLDSRALDLSNLRSEIKSRQEEATYLSNLLGEYIRNFESRLHIAEIQRYQQPLEEAKLAAENSGLSKQEIYAAQASLLAASLERLHDLLGGTEFDGTASDSSGSIHHGTFVLLGPAAIFQSDDGKNIGTAEQRLGSLEPTIIGFSDLADADAAAKVISDSTGLFPLDPTLGSAHKIEQTKQTMVDEFYKGGMVMYVIAGLAGLVLLVIILKFLHLFTISTPNPKKVYALLKDVAAHDQKGAIQKAKKLRGPVGKMLVAGVEHLMEPRELIEEVMYEKMMAAQLKLKSFLPFIAFGAASAPLLGLLGTVTGIISTFQLITVFGSGDVKSLSGGISEALITTKYGLIVAIPSLLFHTLLSRKARSIGNEMEKAAVALVNQIGKTPYRREDSDTVMDKLSVSQVQQLIRNMAGRPQVENSSVASAAKYSPDSAGARMDSQVISIFKASTVAEAIKKIRAAGMNTDIDSIYVIDNDNKYVGHILVHHLLTRPEHSSVEPLTDTTPLYVRVDSHHDEVRQRFREHNLRSVPVLDNSGRLVGCVKRNGNGD